MPPASPRHGGDERELVELPVGEREAERDRDRRLEDHRAGDVPERQAVLAVADPEEAVRLLGQLGGQRREDQREHERLDPDVLGDVDQLLDEQVRAADDRGQPDDELEHHRARRAARRPGVAVEVERADRLDLLDRAAAAQGAAHVVRVGDDEDDRERDLERRRARRCPSAAPSGEEDEEEDEVALERLDVGAQLGALLAALAVDQRRDPDQRHRDRREQERRADDRPDRDVLGALGAADDRDDRDQRLGHRRADRGEQAARRALAHPEPLPAHSTAFVNTSAPARITAKLIDEEDDFTSIRLRRSGEEGDREDRVEGQELDALEPVRLAVLGDVVGDQDREQRPRRARTR